MSSNFDDFDSTRLPSDHRCRPPLPHSPMRGARNGPPIAAQAEIYIRELKNDAGLEESKSAYRKEVPLLWEAQIFWGEEGEIRYVTAIDPLVGEMQAVAAGLGALKRRCAVELHVSSELSHRAAHWLARLTTDKGRLLLDKGIIHNREIWLELSALAVRHDINVYEPTSGLIGFGDWQFVGRVNQQPSGFVWCGSMPPWDQSLNAFRTFSTEDLKNASICYRIDGSEIEDARIQLIKNAATRLRPKQQ